MVSTVTLLALLSAYTRVSLADEPIVTTTRGKVRGASLAPLLEVNQFLGIPYAKQSRFQEAVQYPAWSGIRNATKHGASCPQSQCKNFLLISNLTTTTTRWSTKGRGLICPALAAGHRDLIYITGPGGGG